MESTAPPNDPLSNFSLSVFSVYGLLVHAGENTTRPFGQSSARWHVLGRAGHQPQTVAQMARDMGSPRQSVQYIANRLLNDGLIVLKNNPANKRAKLVELTPKGAEILRAIYARDQEWSGQIMTKLDARQLQEIADALDNIARIFETHVGKHNNQENKE